MISISIPTVLASTLWVLVEGCLAYLNGMLTPAQMSMKYLDRRGLPFMAHGGMWGDIVIIGPLASGIVGTYGDNWTSVQIVTMLAIGMSLSAAMHWTYVQTPFPDSLAWKGEGITAAGWLHVVYMGATFAVIGLLYFCTPGPNPMFVLLTGLLLGTHVVIGTHVPLGIFNELEPMAWCPKKFLVPQTGYTVLGAWSVLIALTMFAVGVSGGLLLAMTLALLAVIVWACSKLIPRVMFVTAFAMTAALFALLVWMWSQLIVD